MAPPKEEGTIKFYARCRLDEMDGGSRKQQAARELTDWSEAYHMNTGLTYAQFNIIYRFYGVVLWVQSGKEWESQMRSLLCHLGSKAHHHVTSQFQLKHITTIAGVFLIAYLPDNE